MASRRFRMTGGAALAAGLAALSASYPSNGTAQAADGLTPYQPEQKAFGLIRSWGNDEMAGVMKRWEVGFRKHQTEVLFMDTLKGSETAQAALYTGVADLALMGREILPLEWYGLFRRKHHFPLEITVATGSHEAPDRTFALAVLVHRDNPIAGLTLKQLDGIFGEERDGAWDSTITWQADRARSAAANVRRWGQLGLRGEWANKPINVYGYPTTVWGPSDIAPGAAFFFRSHVLDGADKWKAAISEYETGEQIADALGKDRYGIAYTALGFQTPLVKPIALAGADGTSPVELTKETVASRQYPLARSVYIFIDRTPGEPVDAKVKEFLRYVLSRQGQQDVAEDGGYLPLTAEMVREQLKKID